MAVPSDRYKILPLRGLKASLDAGLANINEGEICYATDEDRYYQKEGGVLVASSASSLAGLSDVDTTTTPPTDGQALVWDNANSQWEPGTVSGGGSLTVRDTAGSGGTVGGSASSVSTLSFNTNNGFSVTDLGSGEAFVELGSSFAPWHVSGQTTLSPAGEEPVEFVASTNITITTNATASPKQIIFSASGGLADVVDDTTPQLGGNLDVNGNYIVSASGGDVVIAPDTTGGFVVRGNNTDGSITLNCTANTHGVTIQSPPHSAAATYTLTLPDDTGTSGQVLSTDGTGALSWVDNTGGGGSYTDPLTTDGDIVIRSGGSTTRLGIGSEGQVLKVSSGLPVWGATAIEDLSNVLAPVTEYGTWNNLNNGSLSSYADGDFYPGGGDYLYAASSDANGVDFSSAVGLTEYWYSTDAANWTHISTATISLISGALALNPRTGIGTTTPLYLTFTEPGADDPEFLKYDRANEEYQAQTIAIDDLSDVDTSTTAPTDGQALVWDNANSKWEPGTISGGGGASTALALTDVTGASPTGYNFTQDGGTSAIGSGLINWQSYGAPASYSWYKVYVSKSDDDGDQTFWNWIDTNLVSGDSNTTVDIYITLPGMGAAQLATAYLSTTYTNAYALNFPRNVGQNPDTADWLSAYLPLTSGTSVVNLAEGDVSVTYGEDGMVMRSNGGTTGGFTVTSLNINDLGDVSIVGTGLDSYRYTYSTSTTTAPTGQYSQPLNNNYIYVSETDADGRDATAAFSANSGSAATVYLSSDGGSTWWSVVTTSAGFSDEGVYWDAFAGDSNGWAETDGVDLTASEILITFDDPATNTLENGAILEYSLGQQKWITATPSAGFADPMTTDGDIIIRNAGTTTRLGIGNESQVLTVTSGVPAWEDAAAGGGGGGANLPLVVGTSIDSDATAATSQAVTVPSHSSGDLLVAVIMHRNNGGTISPPTGFSLHGQYLTGVAFSGDTQHLSVYTKTASASEPASYTWTQPNSSRIAGLMAAVNGNAVIDTVTEGYGNADIATISTVADRLNITAATWVYSQNSAAEAYSQSGSGVTEITDSPQVEARLSGGYTTSATTVTSTHDTTTTNNSPNHAMICIALRVESSINDNDDVDTSTTAPTDGQVLVWDNANGKWEPGAAGATTLSGLTDTDINATPTLLLNFTSFDGGEPTFTDPNASANGGSIDTTLGTNAYKVPSTDAYGDGSKLSGFLDTNARYDIVNMRIRSTQAIDTNNRVGLGGNKQELNTGGGISIYTRDTGFGIYGDATFSEIGTRPTMNANTWYDITYVLDWGSAQRSTLPSISLWVDGAIAINNLTPSFTYTELTGVEATNFRLPWSSVSQSNQGDKFFDDIRVYTADTIPWGMTDSTVSNPGALMDATYATTPLTDGQVLAWASANNKWKPANATSLDPLFSFVTVLTPFDGETNGASTWTTYGSTSPTWTAGTATISNSFTRWGGTTSLSIGATPPIIPCSLGTDDWTIEMWTYFDAGTWNSYGAFFRNGLLADTNDVFYFGPNGDINSARFRISNSGSALLTINGACSWEDEDWNHVAICRSGDRYSAFVNGEKVGTGTLSGRTFNSGNIQVDGSESSTTYVQDFRITQGVARYSTEFYPVPLFPHPTS